MLQPHLQRIELNKQSDVCVPSNSGYAHVQRSSQQLLNQLQQQGVCGITAELGRVEAHDLARRLEKHLGGRMQTIFSDSKAFIDTTAIPQSAASTKLHWLDNPRGRKYTGQYYDNAQRTLKLNPALERTAIDRYNSLGYAVNLIYIEGDKGRVERLRSKVFFPLLNTALVFQTSHDMLRFEKEQRGNTNLLLALTGWPDSVDPDGARTAGGGHSQTAKFCARPMGDVHLDPRLRQLAKIQNEERMCQQIIQKHDTDQTQRHTMMALESLTKDLEELNKSMEELERNKKILEGTIQEKTSELNCVMSARLEGQPLQKKRKTGP